MGKYKVLETRQIQKLSPTGATQSVYRVWIETERGATGSIDVAQADWTAEKLKATLDKFATELDLAFSLTE